VCERLTNWLARNEPLVAVLLVCLFFLLNLSIASRSAFGAWMDEPGYVDPGLNLASGKGWTTSMWPLQTDREFFAQQSPLFPGALSVWARVFGTSMVATRAYCYFLGAAGTFFFWRAAFQFKWLSPLIRLFWIVLLSTEARNNWMMRNGRYDVWIFAGLGLALLGASCRRPAWKYGFIFLGGFLGPAAGFVCVPYIFGMAVGICAITRFAWWKEAMMALVGAAVGVLAVFAFCAAAGFLGVFANALRSHSIVTATSSIQDKFNIFAYPQQDLGVELMIAALLVLTLAHWRTRTTASRRWMLLGWGVVIGVPAIMLARASFTTIYFYMVIIPLSLAILALFSLPERPAFWRIVFATVGGLLALTCATGLPARMFVTIREWKLRDPRIHDDFVKTYIRSNDLIFADYQFYYSLRDHVRFSMNGFYLPGIHADQAAQINVVCLPTNTYPNLDQDSSPLGLIGGGWKKVAVFPSEEMQKQLAGHYPISPVCVLYRRETATTSK